MRTAKLTAVSLLLSVSVFFSACTREVQDDHSLTKEIISKGSWSVDYYYTGQDKTALYSNFQFTFNADGTVSGKNVLEQFAGTWSVVRDVNRNDVLQISISSTDPQITELNANWSVTNTDPLVVSMKIGEGSQLRLRKQ
jgi:hypothetical protein